MRKIFWAVIVMVGLIGGSCSAGVNDFCWKYFGTLNRNGNIFYSPYGIATALSILANGATGQTQSEILHALEANNIDELNDAYKNFSDSAAQIYGETFAEANLLLIDKKLAGLGIDKNFRRTVNAIYNSEVRTANFSGDIDGERKKIAGFVSDKTRGFIPDYKSNVTAGTATDLLNVVYFKGKWKIPFEASSTMSRDFTNRDGSISYVEMMLGGFEREISYRADENFCGIELPYSTGAAMYLILPRDENSLDVAELWNNQPVDYRENFLDDLRRAGTFNGNVVVLLPKFELDIENGLVKSLKSLGIEKAFSNDAEFFNIINGTPLKIDNANHRAKVKVNEQGTEAAAVTEINMVAMSAPNSKPPETVYFLAERPFMFVIRDVQSGVILFAGVVNKLVGNHVLQSLE